VDGYVLESYWINQYWFVGFPYWQTNIALPTMPLNAKYVVRFESRTNNVADNNRSIVILIENRTDDIETEDRDVIVAIDNRDFIVPSESREYDIGQS
jgi:hypothetical protein